MPWIARSDSNQALVAFEQGLRESGLQDASKVVHAHEHAGWQVVFHSKELWVQLTWHQDFLDFYLEPGGIHELEPWILGRNAVPLELIWCKWQGKSYDHEATVSELTNWFFAELNRIVEWAGDLDNWPRERRACTAWAIDQKNQIRARKSERERTC